MSYKIVNMWVPSNMYRYKSPYKMKPNYLAVHNTANTATARNEVAYMRRNTSQTSYHVAVDDKEVVQALPFNRNAWHTGDGNDPNDSGNRLAIGVEIAMSMDNGYSGRYSDRHAQAEKNAAEYIAHVLDQYGWGVDKLRQHYNYTGKDCPHKMRAWNNWSDFKNMVQGHLDAIKGGSSASSKPSTPAASGDTYTVQSGDTLWGIANANDTSVSNIKSLNSLSGNTISVGQTLSLSGSSSSGSGTGGAGNIKYKEDEWNTNEYGTHYVSVDATFVVGSEPIYVYDNAPYVNPDNRAPSQAQPGAEVAVFEACRQDGYVWATYETGSGTTRYMPIKKWNGGGGKVTSSGLYGKFI